MKKLLPFFFLLFVSTSFATHNMAGDITYRYIGTASNPYQYEVTVKTYTDWVGPSGTDRCEIAVYFGGGDSVMAPRVNGTTSILCDPPNTDGVLIGGCVSSTVKMNVYKTTHDFPGPGNYTISTKDPTMSPGICNIPSSTTLLFFLQAELNISPFLGPNNSPTYYEIPVICDTVGIVGYYNPSVIDSDGDSLYYELIPPTSSGSSLPSASTSFTIDNFLGTVTWNTPTTACNYVFDFKISEYRNVSGFYYYIGHSMQEVWSEVFLYSGIPENTQTTSVNIFPNPSNGIINFTVENASQEQEYQLVISNSLGQIVKTISINNNSAIINEDELSAGIYFYSLLADAEVVNKGKFVILDGIMK